MKMEPPASSNVFAPPLTLIDFLVSSLELPGTVISGSAAEAEAAVTALITAQANSADVDLRIIVTNSLI
ncbi:MAG TPA: hypothetical protein VFY36_10580 [Solirubrobacteraceae bacterium]|nr:hypothetical protein [Solirubrobacteraceae bacterium]